jgi:hypothetical protein
MKLTESHTFKTDNIQKKTLITLKVKYKVKVSKFIRSAIKEKLEREKDGIFKNYIEVENYLKKANDCPF